MARMRLQKDVFAYIKEKDPQTALTPHALRCMVLDGTIPHVDVGRKKLIIWTCWTNILNTRNAFPLRRNQVRSGR